MKWVDSIKNALFKPKPSESAKIARQPRSFEQCQTVAVLFSANDSSNLPAVFQHIAQLQAMGKTVSALGYWDAADFNQAPDLHPLFNRKNLSFTNQPQGEAVGRFLQQNPDLLLALYQTPVQPLDYLLAMSSAKLRAGFMLGENMEHLELLLLPAESLAEGIQQLHQQLLSLKIN